MSAIKTTQIDGDVSIGRNAAIGGRANIQGSVRVGHHLRVDGWLDAPNVKGCNKGVYATPESLESTYPNPKPGWFAGVGTSTPFALYTAVSGQWEPTGGTMDLNVDMAQWDADVERLSDGVLANTGAINELEGTVGALEGTVDSHTGAISGLTSQLAGHTSTLSSHSSSIANLQNLATSLSAVVQDMQGRMDDEAQVMSGLSAQVETLFGKTNSGYRIAGFIAPGNSFDARAVENTCYVVLNNTGRSWWVPSGQSQGAQGVCYMPPAGYSPSGHAPSSVTGWTPFYLMEPRFDGRTVIVGYRSGTWTAHPLESATKTYVDSLMRDIGTLDEKITALQELLDEYGVDLEGLVWNPDEN